ncbi:PPOX class probable F420-dependent enzyme [Actinoplanes tereljensis]
MLLTTFRSSGEGVATPVWTVPADNGRVGMWTAAGTGKFKRMRRNPHVTIQACSPRGHTKRGAPVYHGLAEIVSAGPLFTDVQVKIRAKYGRTIPLVRRISRLMGRLKRNQTLGDTVVLISITNPTPNDTSSRPAAEEPRL